MKTISFTLVEKQMRKKTFGIISTISTKNFPHSTGVVFGMSPPQSQLFFYILTGKNYAKTNYIRKNPNVAFTIPFPHYYFRFTPASTVTFQGKAGIIPINDLDAINVFKSKRILKMILPTKDDVDELNEDVFIRIRPSGTFFCYGVGYGILDIARNISNVAYSVDLPKNR